MYKEYKMIEIKNLVKRVKNGGNDLEIVRNIDLTIEDSAFVVILGPSGSGKTTLLNMIAGLTEATSGSICIDGQEILQLNRKQKEEFRKNNVGYIFQEYHLLPCLTALENVYISTKNAGVADEKAKETLERVGLKAHMSKLPEQLSGGQRQRIAIARAVAKLPKFLICDEPTGALDSKSSEQVLELIQHINHTEKITVIMVTHNPNIAQLADHVITIKDGKIIEEQRQQSKKMSEVEI